MAPKVITPEIQARIVESLARTRNVTRTAAELNLNRETVRKYGHPKQDIHSAVNTAVPVNLPEPAPEAGGPTLPEPSEIKYQPFDASNTGVWGVISDVHIPYHDLPTIRAWVDECKKRSVVGLLLNGDILDCYQVSDHQRDPSKPRMREEIDKGKQFLHYLRSQFPNARIILKEGNHDYRLMRYLSNRAADIFDLEEVHLPALLHVQEYGVEWVADKRLIMLGKLPVIHGHEYQGGGGVMPARWLYLRTGESALMGHFHQPTFYSFRTISGKEVGMWSTGCACFLSPEYRPLNQWGHGYAMVEVSNDGGFHVHNRRLLQTGQRV